MRCSSCEPLLDRYVEATLTPREMARVRKHLAQCPHCASLVSELRVVDALLATTKPVELAPNFTFALMAEARTVTVVRRRRFALWTVLTFYVVAAWAVLSALYVALGDHGARLDALRAALTSGSQEAVTAVAAATHSLGLSKPLVLGGVVTVLAVDALLAAGAVILYRALRLRAQRSEAL